LKAKASGGLIGVKGDTTMIQFLEIFGDVMRIATFQWYGKTPQPATRREERPASPARWSPSEDRYPFRRSRP